MLTLTKDKVYSKNILQQLKVIFSVSIILLICSLAASFYSTHQLIKNSEMVNSTNEVLVQSEHLLSVLKDAETGQRGYLLTQDKKFLEPYTGSYTKLTEIFLRLQGLTGQSPIQQKTLTSLKERYEARFAQLEKVITLSNNTDNRNYTEQELQQDMLLGKKIMDDIRIIIQSLTTEENRKLQERLDDQEVFIQYTPYFLVLAALISILITMFAFLRIQNDIKIRVQKEIASEKTYQETKSRITEMVALTDRITQGDYDVESTDTVDDELGRIFRSLNTMTASLKHTFEDLNRRNWLQAGALELGKAMRGERLLNHLTNKLLISFAKHLNAPVGTFYVVDYDQNFKLFSSYGTTHAPKNIDFESGIIGEAMSSGRIRVIDRLGEDYWKIGSSLGQMPPSTIVVIPLQYGSETIAVLELALMSKPSDLELEFIEQNLELMAIGINSALDFIRLQNYLEETQAQAEELQAQHQELENLNAELEAQSQKLQASEEELRVQQEELQQTNEELEERSSLLEERNGEILQKAQELAISTRYKSEFLANMSHELRTPLNSILLLSRLLKDNDSKNLSDDQVEYATVINASGNGLLALIDEILDLSKIEAGKMELEYQETDLKMLTSEWSGLFTPIAKQKHIEFQVEIDSLVNRVIETDRMRLDQIIKNLISNALKFTSEGSVILSIKNSRQKGYIDFIVKDTGIGIAPEKQQMIFEAFQQADGSTKRKYGGTGLGLSICKQLVKLLRGDITLESREGVGSTFTLTLPVYEVQAQLSPYEESLELPSPTVEIAKPEDQFVSTYIPENIPDDRHQIHPGDRCVLIIEDDVPFAKSLLQYTKSKGYKGIVAVRGDEGLKLAIQFIPVGILLDLQLPILSGWEIMDQLKKNKTTRHIPIHIMSSHKMKNQSLVKGAVDFIDKPVAIERMKEIFEKIEYVVSKKAKKVLIVEDNPKHAKALAFYLNSFDIQAELNEHIEDGLLALKSKNIDCVILDMGIPDQKAYETLEMVKTTPEYENIPIIIFTGKSLSLNEELRIKQYADSIIVKTAHSYQRMLDEVSLFLHIMEENTHPNEPKGIAKNLRGMNEVLHGKTVLIADDDVRNIFSLSKSLENYKMNVLTALDGQEAMSKLEEYPNVDVVLLDMMMPNMDGYETARRIRQNSQWRNLPIIAVTAKAMMGDREKCISAGASDYITKPVDVDQLISLLRVWLFDK
ncbi:signal transduction histidine kinase [Dyadobacter jejuensis]|uniref:histidine kinase n=1 Tax=Dyadobacter jejuensis TaxID=1082580 RepID=A0A316AM86_9BACT|nr:response regulator [Dyadobacter jejuensis]PWJ58853.1 signal transduction histidine kinase [Dyadobacter jejuensis]